MEVKCFTLSGAREIFAPLRERTRCTMDSLHARRFDRGRKGLSGQGRMEERNIGELICLRNHSEFLFAASSWFSSKWDIPSEVYEESMKECMERKTGILQWYMIVDGQRNTIAGAGVIENDFHDRKDLTPNLCAFSGTSAIQTVKRSEDNWKKREVTITKDKVCKASVFALAFAAYTQEGLT